MIDVNRHTKRIGILVGLEAHRPERELKNERDRENTQRQQGTGVHAQGALEQSLEVLEYGLHHPDPFPPAESEEPFT
jgi:hypothetical protein